MSMTSGVTHRPRRCQRLASSWGPVPDSGFDSHRKDQPFMDDDTWVERGQKIGTTNELREYVAAIRAEVQDRKSVV